VLFTCGHRRRAPGACGARARRGARPAAPGRRENPGGRAAAGGGARGRSRLMGVMLWTHLRTMHTRTRTDTHTWSARRMRLAAAPAARRARHPAERKRRARGRGGRQPDAAGPPRERGRRQRKERLRASSAGVARRRLGAKRVGGPRAPHVGVVAGPPNRRPSPATRGRRDEKGGRLWVNARGAGGLRLRGRRRPAGAAQARRRSAGLGARGRQRDRVGVGLVVGWAARPCRGTGRPPFSTLDFLGFDFPGVGLTWLDLL
jgi:hypothetical protein